MSRCLLIDADIVAYQSSAANERRYDWGDGVKSAVSDFEAAKRSAKDTLDGLMETLKGDRLLICLSDDWSNFRLSIDATYKGNRRNTQRPEDLYNLKEWLEETYPSKRVQHLEADDILGILATAPQAKEDRIMVSEDKDLQTVPGLLYRPQEPKKGVRSITLAEADEFHLWQTICGDQTDGYPGCPGAGPEAADRLLKGVGYVSHVHTFKSGPRKGLEEIRWTQKDLGSPWGAIVSAFQKARLAEQDALRQARLAFILRHDHYRDGRVIPWSPKSGE